MEDPLDSPNGVGRSFRKKMVMRRLNTLQLIGRHRHREVGREDEEGKCVGRRTSVHRRWKTEREGRRRLREDPSIKILAQIGQELKSMKKKKQRIRRKSLWRKENPRTEVRRKILTQKWNAILSRRSSLRIVGGTTTRSFETKDKDHKDKYHKATLPHELSVPISTLEMAEKSAKRKENVSKKSLSVAALGRSAMVIQRSARFNFRVKGWRTVVKRGCGMKWVRDSDGYIVDKKPTPVTASVTRCHRSGQLLLEILRHRLHNFIQATKAYLNAKCDIKTFAHLFRLRWEICRLQRESSSIYECQDRRSNRLYYRDTKRLTSSWDKPAILEDLESLRAEEKLVKMRYVTSKMTSNNVLSHAKSDSKNEAQKDLPKLRVDDVDNDDVDNDDDDDVDNDDDDDVDSDDDDDVDNDVGDPPDTHDISMETDILLHMKHHRASLGYKENNDIDFDSDSSFSESDFE